MIIKFSLIFRFDVMINTIIIFTKIIFVFTKVSNNNKILIKNVILKFFINLFKHFESLVVRKSSQVSKKHIIYEFLSDENKINIEIERKSLDDHDGVDFESYKVTKK